MDKHTFDPRAAIVYFDLVFEDYNWDDDRYNAETDPDAAERVQWLWALAPENEAASCHRAESLAMIEVESIVHKAIPTRTVGNEGHTASGNLIVKVGVNSIDEAKALAAIVQRMVGGGNDECFLATVPYFHMTDFRLYPQGVNLGFIPLVEIDSAIEDGVLR